ncbi:hypothetical protein FDUTEX481_04930 [Tolypothrix sp. PCC 7601]|nr:hypothetical protein FDUTEX481_04930 [Tolypothrix sp. PCC 7601]
MNCTKRISKYSAIALTLKLSILKLLSYTNSNNVCDTSIYSRWHGTPCPYNLLHSWRC